MPGAAGRGSSVGPLVPAVALAVLLLSAIAVRDALHVLFGPLDYIVCEREPCPQPVRQTGRGRQMLVLGLLPVLPGLIALLTARRLAVPATLLTAVAVLLAALPVGNGLAAQLRGIAYVRARNDLPELEPLLRQPYAGAVLGLVLLLALVITLLSGMLSRHVGSGRGMPASMPDRLRGDDVPRIAAMALMLLVIALAGSGMVQRKMQATAYLGTGWTYTVSYDPQRDVPAWLFEVGGALQDLCMVLLTALLLGLLLLARGVGRRPLLAVAALGEVTVLALTILIAPRLLAPLGWKTPDDFIPSEGSLVLLALLLTIPLTLLALVRPRRTARLR